MDKRPLASFGAAVILILGGLIALLGQLLGLWFFPKDIVLPGLAIYLTLLALVFVLANDRRWR